MDHSGVPHLHVSPTKHIVSPNEFEWAEVEVLVYIFFQLVLKRY